MARRADVGSAIKQRPPGRRAENISRRAWGRSPTTISMRLATIASTGSSDWERASTLAFTKWQFFKRRMSARSLARESKRSERSTPVI